MKLVAVRHLHPSRIIEPLSHQVPHLRAAIDVVLLVVGFGVEVDAFHQIAEQFLQAVIEAGP